MNQVCDLEYESSVYLRQYKLLSESVHCLCAETARPASLYPKRFLALPPKGIGNPVRIKDAVRTTVRIKFRGVILPSLRGSSTIMPWFRITFCFRSTLNGIVDAYMVDMQDPFGNKLPCIGTHCFQFQLKVRRGSEHLYPFYYRIDLFH
jgi:hypothetical protein